MNPGDPIIVTRDLTLRGKREGQPGVVTDSGEVLVGEEEWPLVIGEDVEVEPA